MFIKNIKGKGHKSVLSDDLSQYYGTYKNELKENNNAKVKEDTNISRKRFNTKIIKNNNSKSHIEFESKEKRRIKEVKFSKIEVIKIENWKKYNIGVTGEEILAALIKVSNKKKDKSKTLSCVCSII